MADEKEPAVTTSVKSEDNGYYGGSYGKRPKWLWWALYIIVGGLVYYGIYYFFLKPSNSNSGSLDGGSSTSGSLYGTK